MAMFNSFLYVYQAGYIRFMSARQGKGKNDNLCPSEASFSKTVREGSGSFFMGYIPITRVDHQQISLVYPIIFI